MEPDIESRWIADGESTLAPADNECVMRRGSTAMSILYKIDGRRGGGGRDIQESPTYHTIECYIETLLPK